MPLSKSDFRDRVREQAGDPLRIYGTATGGSLTAIVDTARLTQLDNYWSSLQAFIITTTDGNAPQGEARRIMSSSSSGTSVSVELPFSAAPAAGDTYGIAVFSNRHIDNIIAGVLKEFSDYRPLKFSENLPVTANEKRFTPTSAAAIRYVNKIEKYTAGIEETIYDFTWNKNTRQVEFKSDFYEAKTLTLHAAKSHSLPAAEATAMTYDDEDEDRLVRWCVARIMLSMNANQLRDNFGKLTPQSWTQGPVSENYGDNHKQFMRYGESIIQEIKNSFPSIKV